MGKPPERVDALRAPAQVPPPVPLWPLLTRFPHGQSFALRYPACCASASLANVTTEAGFMPAYPLQPGTRYTLLWRFPCTAPSASVAGGAVDACRVYGCACAAWAWMFASYALTSSGASLMTSRFSAFFSSAALVKLKEPVITVALSI